MEKLISDKKIIEHLKNRGLQSSQLNKVKEMIDIIQEGYLSELEIRIKYINDLCGEIKHLIETYKSGDIEKFNKLIDDYEFIYCNDD